MTCRRKVLPPQPLNWFRNLASLFGDALTIHIALKGSRPVASILTLDFKDSLVYKYGCSDTAAYPLGGMQMLLWTAIKDAKRRGLIELDLGRSDGDHHGLIAFKDRWGASRVASSYLRYPSIRSWKQPGDRTLHLARKAFARMPDKMLIAVGSALYRHAG
jgi:lipid II:glycine glycyltransferase (peptidoglycan interpeptide bridge formation enzyme)